MFLSFHRNKTFKKALLIFLLCLIPQQKATSMDPATAIGAYELALILVPLIIAGQHYMAEEFARTTYALPDYMAPSPSGTYTLPARRHLEAINDAVIALESAEQSIGSSAATIDPLAVTINDHIDTVTKNLKLTPLQAIELSKIFFHQLKVQALEDLKYKDYEKWLKVIRDTNVRSILSDNYYLKQQFLIDRQNNIFYNNLEQRKRYAENVALYSIAAISYVLIKCFTNFIVLPIRDRQYLESQERSMEQSIASNKLFASAYKYAVKHLLHQAINLVSPRGSSAVRSEQLLLLNQADMQCKFGRLCRKFVAQLNSLFINNSGHINFAKFNDPVANKNAARLFNQFITSIAQDHDMYIQYCKAAAKLDIPGMQDVLAQSDDGKIFQVGESVWGAWFKDSVGLADNILDPVEVNKEKFNQDFLQMIMDLRVLEFNARKDSKTNFQAADAIRRSYMAGTAKVPATDYEKVMMNDYGITMHNLLGYYLYKNNLDSSIINFEYIYQEYGLTKSEVQALKDNYGIKHELLSRRFSTEEQRAYFRKFIQELRKILLGGPGGPNPNKLAIAAIVVLATSLIQEDNFSELGYLTDLVKLLVGIKEGVQDEVVGYATGLTVAFAADKALKSLLPLLSKNPYYICYYYVGKALVCLAALSGLSTKWTDLEAFIKAAQSGDMKELGRFGVRTASNLRDLVNIVKSLTEAKLIPAYAMNADDTSDLTRKNVFKSGCCKKINEIESIKDSQVLFKDVQQAQWYKDLSKEMIASLNTTEQAFNNKIFQLSQVVTSKSYAYRVLNNVKTGIEYVRKNPIIPVGLSKALKIDHWHAAFPNIFKNGKWSGFHCDPLKLTHNYSNMECLYEETEGIWYRCYINFNGFAKECTMAPSSWTYEKFITEVYQALGAVDYSKLPLLKNGKYFVEIPFHGVELQAYVNKATSEVATFYITHDNWVDPIRKAYLRSKQ